MADENNAKAVLSICATTSDRVKDLVIKNGQMIFVKDKARLAFDYNDKRTFYNQITELDNDYERLSLVNPASGYYFVIETAILWFYKDGWVQITGSPEEYIFIGVELPALGKKNTLYTDTAKKQISVWDENEKKYVVVADKTDAHVDIDVDILDISDEEINSLFK